MRNRFYALSLGLLISLISVATLFVYARYRLQSNENFERRFPPHMLGRKQQLELTYNSFYLAGADSKVVYLGNHKKADLVIKLNRLTLDTLTIDLSLPDSLRKKAGWQWQFQADAAYCFNFLFGDLYWWTNNKFSEPPKHHRFGPINSLQAISPTHVLVNTFESATRRRIVQSIRLEGPEVERQYLPTQVKEGIYSTQGHLLYDHFSNQLLYVHLYWNRIQLLDNLLQENGEAHTIDLQNRFDMVVTQYGDTAAPQMKIAGGVLNRQASVDKGYLLVLSSQAARNQTLNQLQNFWTIDVYESTTGNYLYSFYLPRKKESMNLDFLLLWNHLFTLEGSTLTRYELNFPGSR
jgi:hypothetical protein